MSTVDVQGELGAGAGQTIAFSMPSAGRLRSVAAPIMRLTSRICGRTQLEIRFGASEEPR